VASWQNIKRGSHGIRQRWQQRKKTSVMANRRNKMKAEKQAAISGGNNQRNQRNVSKWTYQYRERKCENNEDVYMAKAAAASASQHGESGNVEANQRRGCAACRAIKRRSAINSGAVLARGNNVIGENKRFCSACGGAARLAARRTSRGARSLA